MIEYVTYFDTQVEGKGVNIVRIYSPLSHVAYGTARFCWKEAINCSGVSRKVYVYGAELIYNYSAKRNQFTISLH